MDIRYSKLNLPLTNSVKIYYSHDMKLSKLDPIVIKKNDWVV